MLLSTFQLITTPFTIAPTARPFIKVSANHLSDLSWTGKPSLIPTIIHTPQYHMTFFPRLFVFIIVTTMTSPMPHSSIVLAAWMNDYLYSICVTDFQMPICVLAPKPGLCQPPQSHFSTTHLKGEMDMDAHHLHLVRPYLVTMEGKTRSLRS